MNAAAGCAPTRSSRWAPRPAQAAGGFSRTRFMLSIESTLPVSALTHDVRRRWLGTRSYWLCQAVGWGAFFAINVVNILAFPAPDLQHATLPIELLSAALMVAGFLLNTHLLRIVILRCRQHRLTLAGLALRLLGWLPVFAAAQAGLMSLVGTTLFLAAAIDSGTWTGNGWSEYFNAAAVSLLMLGVWTGLYLGASYFRQYQVSVVERLRLEAAVKDTELRALKAQLYPHFLFNSLNTLRALIPRELDQPRNAITLLADLLRASLTLGQHETVTLAQELETVDNYLALEQLRHEARLRVRRTVAAETLTWTVPPFVVQTLVENAVKYGIDRREEGGEVGVEAAVREGELHLRVTSPGRIATSTASTGVGLKNARARLVLLFGETATLTLAQAEPDLVAADVRLPKNRLPKFNLPTP